MKNKFAVQLYSVRNELNIDAERTINKIAEIGYSGVEMAGVPRGMSYSQFVKIIQRAGLVISSAHLPLPVTANKKYIFEILSEMGTSYLVTGKMALDFSSIDLIKRSCEEFNLGAAEAEKYGIKLVLHNHWWEFEDLDGKPVYKTILENLSEKIFFELDTYWIKVAGKDPAYILKKLINRAPLLHMEDGHGSKENFKMVALGQGIMDFKPILTESSKTTEWYIVELDECDSDVFEALQMSYEYLQNNIK